MKPQVGKVSEYSAECAQSRVSGVSHTPAVPFQVAMCFGAEYSSDILDHHDPGFQLVDGFGHVLPQAGTGAGSQAAADTGGGQVLAWEPAADHIDGWHG
jgi:hypothetical protein